VSGKKGDFSRRGRESARTSFKEQGEKKLLSYPGGPSRKIDGRGFFFNSTLEKGY